jgi:hypothetical protein
MSDNQDGQSSPKKSNVFNLFKDNQSVTEAKNTLNRNQARRIPASRNRGNQAYAQTIAQSIESRGLRSGTVIKASELKANSELHASPSASPNSAAHAVKVDTYVPTQIPLGLRGRRIQKPGILSATVHSSLALASLKQNFKALNDLQTRLRFMLQELEEFVKE